MERFTENGSLSIEQLRSICTPCIGQLQTGFSSAVSKGYTQFRALEAQGKKQRLGNIYISLLRTGMLLRDPWFQIDFMDGRDWADIVDCHSDWDLEPAAQAVYQQLGLLEDNINDQTILLCVPEILQIVKENFDVLGADWYGNLAADWYLGEYMGKYERL